MVRVAQEEDQGRRVLRGGALRERELLASKGGTAARSKAWQIRGEWLRRGAAMKLVTGEDS